jgi:DNA-binding transcriptional LysR family regulator
VFDDLNNIPVFVHIVRQKSITGAAEALRMPMATVSRKLSEMEKTVGARLIERSARHFSLTETGQKYFEKAELLYEQLRNADDALKQSSEQTEGTIRLSVPVDFATEFLAQAIADFCSQYPLVKIEIDLSSKRVNFGDENVDVALRMGQLDDISQVSRSLGRMSRSLYAAQALPNLSTTGLDQQSFVLLESSSGANELRLKQADTGEIINVQCHGAVRVNNMGMLIKLTAAGAGLAVIPDALAQPYEKLGVISRVLAPWQASPIEIHLVYRSRTLQPKRLKLFIAHIQAHVLQLDLSPH